ncbi:MAG: HAMP domain-containing histidine kinase [Gemmatales bacterium]|nr:HAMP domain-containing histidine kinase [Gemmatales bacterium]MDW8387709.1 HAMP domain-containing sensor histidine kinase [Gemmatales bacterium]
MDKALPTSKTPPVSRRLLLGLVPPFLLLLLVLAALSYALYTRSQLTRQADREALREWLEESRVHRKTLPDLVREYLAQLPANGEMPLQDDPVLRLRAEELQEHLAALGRPTRLLAEQLPLFPVIYELRLSLPDRTVQWESGLPRPRPVGQVAELKYPLLGESDPRVVIHVAYQLHAYNRRQEEEAQRQRLVMWLSLAAVAGLLVSTAWAWFALRRERQREIQTLLAQQQIEHAERVALENQLRREEAEHRRAEAERELLEQRLAAQAAEQRALEIKSQIFAGVGIMAGSYAHNIKNLLVRPADLIRRCLASPNLDPQVRQGLQEIGATLNTVTDRLQLILKTVRRDPSRSVTTRLDLNQLAREAFHNWTDMAEQKWKIEMTLELAPEPLVIVGDPSHLSQAIENLIFNARDAAFEMRNHVREQARNDPSLSEEQRRHRLIEAAAWKGRIVLRTRRDNGEAVIEVEDNGIGMTDEVRQRCTETHFTTKQNNALYHGLSTGMGLGLAFVRTVLEGHGGSLEIDTVPLAGTTMRMRLPLADRQAKAADDLRRRDGDVAADASTADAARSTASGPDGSTAPAPS